MSEIVDIKKAREIMLNSGAFSRASKKINNAILSASEKGISKTEVVFYAGEMSVYESVASLLETKGYRVEIVREFKISHSILIRWGFDRWKNRCIKRHSRSYKRKFREIRWVGYVCCRSYVCDVLFLFNVSTC